jgi:hypothetical protein
VQWFRFTPRHPITRVAFTADGSEVVTAQPHTAITVRDRAGQPRAAFPTADIAAFHELHVHPTLGWIAARTPKWAGVYDPADARPYLMQMHAGCVGIAQAATGFRFGVRADIDFHTYDYPERDGVKGVHIMRPRTTGEVVAISPDARFALAVRQRTKPVLLDLRTGRAVAEVGSALRSRNVRLGLAVIAFSADGSKMALGNGDSLAVFDLSRVSADDSTVSIDATEKRKVLYPLFTIDRPDPVSGRGTHADRTAEHWLPPVAFDAVGRSLLLVGLRNRVQRIDLATGSVMAEWNWRADAVQSLAVASDGLTAAAGCRLGELILWDLE